MHRIKLTTLMIAAVAFVATACSEDVASPESSTPETQLAEQGQGAADVQRMSEDTRIVFDLLVDINDRLAVEGAPYRAAYAEWMAGPDSEEAGQTVFFRDVGNKQLALDWVPGDPRREGRTTITYLVDQSDGATDDGLTNADTEPAIDRAMDTWASRTCSDGLVIVKLEDDGSDPDAVDFFLGFGGLGGNFVRPFVTDDIVHAGWVPEGILGENTIGVTFTFQFVDPDTGEPTDIDNDGKIDAAFREIYYNDAFDWAIDANIDVETVALHEAGHGLSQGHFGAAFLTEANGKLHFSPLALMNAAYSGVRQSLLGTDEAGHCSIWGAWPQN